MSRELLKRALMARTIGYTLPPSLVKDIEAELAKPDPEPFGYVFEYATGKFIDIFSQSLSRNKKIINDHNVRAVNVYASPQAKQKPLTDDEIIEIGINVRAIENNDFLPVAFARAIEKAHGITS